MYRCFPLPLRQQYLRQSVNRKWSPVQSTAARAWYSQRPKINPLNQSLQPKVGEGLLCREQGAPTQRVHPNSSVPCLNTCTGIKTWERMTSSVGFNKTGYIDMNPGERLLYFDNIFPLKTALFDLRYLITRLDKVSFESRIKKHYIPPEVTSPESPYGFRIISIIPRIKDGGAFVKYISSSPEAVEEAISKYLKDSLIKPWYSPFHRVKAFPVLGRPWLEDIRMFPSTKLRVEFAGSDSVLSQEKLYTLFRRYGKIVDITPQPPASKDLPRYAIIQYTTIRSATAARNCLHGLTVKELETITGKEIAVTIRIFYERTMKVHWIRDWIFSHPRIVVPIFAAILAAVTVAIFDPVRTWFIEAKITRSLHFTESPYWAWLKKYTIGRLPIGDKRDGMHDLWAVWDERKESAEQLQAWLRETDETFIVVQGPRGSGKKDLVIDTVLKGRKNVLVIDCEPIGEAHGDSATIAAAASQVGYRPVFSWLNTISSLLDLAAQGTLGSPAGFSQTLETQFNKILLNTGTALKRIALKGKRDSENDMRLSDDEYLSTHPEKRPVVVIDNFLHMEGNSIIYERLAGWAALLVSANTAHVIFLTNDTSFSKSLAKSLPDRVFRSILLGDAAPESAKRFVLKHINYELSGESNEKALSELDSSIQALGGRLTDLESLARRIKAGQSPKQAVQEIIESSASEILKLYFLDGGSRKKRTWSIAQAWYLVKTLAPNGEIPFNQVVIHPLFLLDEEPIQNLEQAEMIQIVTNNGRPYSIRPGRPVYQAAFRRLLDDKVLTAKMELHSFKAIIKTEEAIIEKAEKELGMLAILPEQPKGRAGYLLKKIVVAHQNIMEAEKAIAGLKKCLAADY